MNSAIYLYNGEDGHALGAPLSLSAVLRPALERLLGRSLLRARLGFEVYPVAATAITEGQPRLIHLLAQYGYARAVVWEDDRISYRHPHRIAELLGRELQTAIKARYPDVPFVGYCLALPGLPPPPLAIYPLEAAQRDAPAVEGSVAVKPYGKDEKPSFRIRRVEPPPPPLASLEDFRLLEDMGDHQAFVKVLLPTTLFQELQQRRSFSGEWEEGGFLVGKVYRDRDKEGSYILRLSAALEAHHSGASLLHFTYTGDSFSAMKRTLREEYPEESLLGWYHTHLFAATEQMGLSSIDLELHFTTFRQPWQLAGLLNLVEGQARVLRFYVRQGALMVPCPQWLIP